MINKKSILAIVLIAIIAVPIISIYGADDVDAATDDKYLFMDTGTLTFGGFDSRTEGTVSITIENNTDVEAIVNVYVTYQQHKDNILGSMNEIVITAGELEKVDLKFMIDSQGTKDLTIWAKSETSEVNFFKGVATDEVGHNFSIYVEQSIWSNWGTYVAIILIVAIVGIAVFIKYRNVPKAEQITTFTELENLKKSKRSQSTSSKSPTVEKKRYESDKRKR